MTQPPFLRDVPDPPQPKVCFEDVPDVPVRSVADVQAEHAARIARMSEMCPPDMRCHRRGPRKAVANKNDPTERWDSAKACARSLGTTVGSVYVAISRREKLCGRLLKYVPREVRE
jgi:hypothetical protein